MAIAHHRQIAAQLLDQMQQLGGLLLGENIDLQFKLFR